jgi:hypothetical protein
VNSSSNQGTLPNWVIASVPLDLASFPQTRNGDVYLAFWVIVWMEDAAGNLVPEIPGHGLTASPAATSYTSITAVPFESHSNNAGLYGAYTPYYVCPVSAPCVSPDFDTGGNPPGARRAKSTATVDVGEVKAASPQVLVDKRTIVSARLSSNDFKGFLPIAFYDSDPALGAPPFDVHHIWHVRPNDTYLSRAVYRPQTCGRHTIYVVAHPERETRKTATGEVGVTIDANATIGTLRAKLAGAHLGTGANPLLQDLDRAQQQLALGKAGAAANHFRLFAQHVSEPRYAGIPALDPRFFASLAELAANCLAPEGERRGTSPQGPALRPR